MPDIRITTQILYSESNKNMKSIVKVTRDLMDADVTQLDIKEGETLKHKVRN